MTANTVTLNGAAPAGGAVVTLQSSSASASAPSVTVPDGAMSVNFTITTTAVTASTPVTISAAYGGVSKSATLTLVPASSSGPLTAFTCSPTSFVVGASTTCTVTINSPASIAGVAVSISTTATGLT